MSQVAASGLPCASVECTTASVPPARPENPSHPKNPLMSTAWRSVLGGVLSRQEPPPTMRRDADAAARAASSAAPLPAAAAVGDYAAGLPVRGAEKP